MKVHPSDNPWLSSNTLHFIMKQMDSPSCQFRMVQDPTGRRHVPHPSFWLNSPSLPQFWALAPRGPTWSHSEQDEPSMQLNTTKGSRLFITSKARRTGYKMKRNLFLTFILAIILFFCTLHVQPIMLYSGHYTGFQGAAYMIQILCLNLVYTLICKLRESKRSAKINIFCSAPVDKGWMKKLITI